MCSTLEWSLRRRNYFILTQLQLIDIVAVDHWCACRWDELCHECQFRLNLAGFCTVLIVSLPFFDVEVAPIQDH